MRIPTEKHAEILRRAATGESSDAIAAWLTLEGIEVTGRSIRKMLEKRRTERADVTKAIVRDELGKTLTADLSEMDDLLRRARAIEDAVAPGVDEDGRPTKGDPALALKAIEQQRKIIDTRLHYSGAGEPDAGASTLGDLMALAFKG